MNVGDIVVLISTDDEWLKSALLTDIGSMHKLLYFDGPTLKVSGSGLYLKPRCFRLASSAEKEAYDKGTRHIRDIVFQSEFKKDDYIVILINSTSSYFRINWCYKQRESLTHIRVYKDSSGDENGTRDIQFSIKSHWRYATVDEVSRYNENNKPFDTKIDAPFNYVGRYIKCLKDGAFSTDHKIGDYVLLDRNDPKGRYRATIATSPRDWQYPANHEMADRGWEVMPAGWIPDRKESNLDIAKREYPVGTIFKSPENGNMYTIGTGTYWMSSNDKDIIANIEAGRGEFVYYRAKWAEIVPKSESTLCLDIIGLPAKWTIKRDLDNYKVINQWFIDNGHGDPSDSIKYIVMRSDTYICHSSIPPGYTEITFDQFKRWVMRPAIVDVKADSTKCIKPTDNLEFQEPVTIAKSKNKSKLVIIN